MKFWYSDYIFEGKWEDVCKAAIRKYPNPMNSAVVTIDVIDRKVKNGVLYTHRLIGSTWGVPGWLSSLIRVPSITHANERSEIDPTKKLMVLRSRNITLCNVIMVDETIWYRPCRNNPEKMTHLRQEAIIYVDGVPLSSLVEKYVVNTFASNAKKGRRAMEWMLKQIKQENIVKEKEKEEKKIKKEEEKKIKKEEKKKDSGKKS